MTAWRFLVCTLIFFGLSQIGNTQKSDISLPKRHYQDRSNIIKINIFSLVSKDLILSYEQALNVKSSVELKIKWLGIPIGQDRPKKGIAGDMGYKIRTNYFLKSSNDQYYDHLLQGSYFKPLIGFQYLNIADIPSNTTRNLRIVHIGIELGLQYVFDNVSSIDFYAGVHRYMGPDLTANQMTTVNSPSENWRAGDLWGRDNSALSIGWRFGYLFCSYEKQLSRKK